MEQIQKIQIPNIMDLYIGNSGIKKALKYDTPYLNKENSLRLTHEQEAILKADKPIMLIQACAGSGKTATMLEYCKKHSHKKILYLCFNKNLQEEVYHKIKDNHLSHVESKTIHSSCYGTMMPEDRRERLVWYGYSPSHFRIRGFSYKHAKELDKFLKSDELTPKDPLVKRAFQMLLESDEMPITHDLYTKEFHLQKKLYAEDCIIVDEAQDLSGVMIGIINNQVEAGKEVILVGDQSQKIYGFLEAIDGFKYLEEKVPKENILYNQLTTCFRCPKSVIDVANVWLDLSNASLMKPFVNDDGKDLSVNEKQFPNAIIFRSNFFLFKFLYYQATKQSQNAKLAFGINFSTETYTKDTYLIMDYLNGEINNFIKGSSEVVNLLNKFLELDRNAKKPYFPNAFKEYLLYCFYSKTFKTKPEDISAFENIIKDHVLMKNLMAAIRQVRNAFGIIYSKNMFSQIFEIRPKELEPFLSEMFQFHKEVKLISSSDLITETLKEYRGFMEYGGLILMPNSQRCMLLTAHKSKGLEFPYIEIADDFTLNKQILDTLEALEHVLCDPKASKAAKEPVKPLMTPTEKKRLYEALGGNNRVYSLYCLYSGMLQEEINLAYVTITRAMKGIVNYRTHELLANESVVSKIELIKELFANKESILNDGLVKLILNDFKKQDDDE